ncbi:MAG TPA: DnaA/Hda family protein, partial [Desulfitobacteriaceae bacterium]|nr:DnaA/Hda family protein [Desulfitobacteriaceae bacterium]
INNTPPVILIYGPQGLGKTTMLNFLYERIRREGVRTELINAQSFSRKYAYAAQNNLLPVFRKRYRSPQLLVIDDLQILAGKTQTLRELLYTYEHMTEYEGKIVVSLEADTPNLNFLGESLASRYLGGLVLRIRQPAREEMVDFIGYYLDKKYIRMEQDAVQYLAGLVNDLQMVASFLDKVSESAAKKPVAITLENLQLYWSKMEYINCRKTEPKNIIRVTAEVMEISEEDLLGFKRAPKTVEARQLAIHAVRLLCRNSYPEIGRIFSRGHGAIMYACRQIDKKIAQDDTLRQKLEAIVKVFSI